MEHDYNCSKRAVVFLYLLCLNSHMDMPQFGQPQAENPYIIPQPGSNKKKTSLLMFGGLAVVLLLLGLLLFGGKKPGGQESMLTAVNSTGEALGAIHDYSKELKTSSAQNNIALTNIILTGNYQSLGSLYHTTYNKKQAFSSSLRATLADQKVLEQAVQNDTMDTELPALLQQKVATVESALTKAKPNFTSTQSRTTITTAQTDYASLADILQKN